MSVRRGGEWGTPGALAPGTPVVAGDAELVDAVTAALRGGATPEVGLTGGDLHSSLGSPAHDPADLLEGRAARYPVDLGLVDADLVDGGTVEAVFCAHLLAVEGRRAAPLFSVRTLVVMNATHLGRHDLGPRAHPGDGLLDVTDGRLGTWDRIRSRRRMRTGTHLPHPALATARVAEFEAAFERPARLVLDGRPVTVVTALRVRCLADAVTVVA